MTDDTLLVPSSSWHQLVFKICKFFSLFFASGRLSDLCMTLSGAVAGDPAEGHPDAVGEPNYGHIRIACSRH